MFSKKKTKQVKVKVVTLESEMYFDIDKHILGQNLFDIVCRTIGLRESWYFGLRYKDTKGNETYLKMTRKVFKQHVNIKEPIFTFCVKFYPENVAEELIQEITQHLFFLQTKKLILSMDIYCQPEASVLLASYAVQAEFGDLEDGKFREGELANKQLLPQRVVDQYQMTPAMWEDRIKIWYSDHKGMSRAEAEMEYLKIAQDLDMFGVSYFPITNAKNTNLWLGVTALGMNIYKYDNKMIIENGWQWNEIKNVKFSGKKFTIEMDAKDKDGKKSGIDFNFYSENLTVNEIILDLCMGNHNLYMNRRRPDSMEIQQMKAQAKEEKERRQLEKNKLQREKQLREVAERDRAALEEKILKLQEDIAIARDALRASEQTAELLAEKNRLAEEEAMLLSKKACEVEREVEREKTLMRMNAIKTAEEKMFLEKRNEEYENLSRKLAEEAKLRTLEAEQLRNDLMRARLAEKEAKEKLLIFLNQPISISTSTLNGNENNLCHVEDDMITNGVDMMNNDYSQLTMEIERERMDYIVKSKHVHDQLNELRNEIEVLKIMDRTCPFDDITNDRRQTGENKYSTLRKLRANSTKARVAFFEEL